MMTRGLQDLVKDLLKFFENLGKASLAINLIQASAQRQEATYLKPLTIQQGKIEFKEVTFGYESAKALFKDLSITIEPQQKVGLVGYSGSGKTTFVNLILGLFSVQKGAILIDGQDISQVNPDSLHESISFIPQQPLLFNRSIYENIAYGNLQASRQEIIAAAQIAHADEFIRQLPEGYDTVIGEQGIKLSGGQRQRIAIARAMVKNAKIWVLDEISSELDPITEFQLHQSLATVMQGRTILAIAHRLSTLLDMDRFLVFDQGHIVEDGTHEALLKKRGMYFQLWQNKPHTARKQDSF